jgi:hypothetical protein
MTSRKTILLLGLLIAYATAQAQDVRSSSSLFLQAHKPAGTTISFSTTAPGIAMPIRWGLDVAWLNEQNIRKGINFIGRENLSLARSSFQMNAPLDEDTYLTPSQQTMLRSRTQAIDIISPNIDIVLNADQGDGSTKFIHPYYSSNNMAKPDRWAKLIDASVAFMQTYYPAHNIVAVSPFNEPDYVYWNEGTLGNFKEIAKLLKEDYPRFKDIAITAGNTLNNDEALKWYNGVKPYVTWGNTHQLAGTFDTFASFWQQVVADGNYPYADELHNVGEAMIAANYGMKAGIWWGFDSRARGEFCRISNHGKRLAYAENRADWTAASIYRNEETGEVKAFVGGSERQATNSTYLFLSPDRDVYFDGQGPLRSFRMEYPGGTGYSQGQTNAERVYNITSGEDVERKPVTAGKYKIMNKGSLGLVSVFTNSNIKQDWLEANAAPKDQNIWQVAPANPRVGGDFSFYTLTNSASGLHINVLNNSTLPKADVIAYNANNASNEQWSIEYAGDGFYYIRNRESGMYLTLRVNRKRSNIDINQDSLYTDSKRDQQLWRLLPLDAPTETDAPDAPTGLTAKEQTASVKLTWTASTATDVASYTMLRANVDDNDWNTIARGLTTTEYIDNTCRPNNKYTYKVVAIDYSQNASAPTESATAGPSGTKEMIAAWQFEDNIHDTTANMLDAITTGSPAFSTDSKEGKKAIIMNGTNWIELPYAIADMDEMTITMWAKWSNSTKIWTRLFDFGNGTDQYMFLTPSNGNNMRFAIRNGGAEQTVNANIKFPANQWHHVALTIGSREVTIWLDGKAVGASTGITIKPSDLQSVLNFLGRSQYNNDPMFAGALDDVRIYNYPLTQEGIQSIIADPTGIAKPEVETEKDSSPAYGLTGSRVPNSYKGVVVKQNKKIIRR